MYQAALTTTTTTTSAADVYVFYLPRRSSQISCPGKYRKQLPPRLRRLGCRTTEGKRVSNTVADIYLYITCEKRTNNTLYVGDDPWSGGARKEF